MTRKERYEKALDVFRSEMPDAGTELEFGSTFQLLVAVVLSAQCTDKRVNAVTPALFARYPTAAAMASATPDDLLDYISSVSYPNSKARHLAALAQMLVEKHGGEVPQDMEGLLALPGVGRKTANVMLSVAFGQSAIAVDTHVFRGTDAQHTRSRPAAGAPLAAAARPLRMHGAEAPLRQMPLRELLPQKPRRAKGRIGRRRGRKPTTKGREYPPQGREAPDERQESSATKAGKLRHSAPIALRKARRFPPLLKGGAGVVCKEQGLLSAA